MSAAGLGWGGIARLGLVQASIGAMVMLATSLLNRVMVVEYGLAAAVPAGLVAWHYAIQLSRPLWGHGSDRGRRRTPWIVGGMAVLALGALLAVDATLLMGAESAAGAALAILAFTMIGAGVGASGTSLLALLAGAVSPERRAAAAAVTWIMMVAGIAISAGVAGSLLEPFSPDRLALVAGGVALAAFCLTLAATAGLERRLGPTAAVRGPAPDLRAALREMAGDPEARRFTAFVFVSMLAYSMQDLILEPFAGLVFGMSPGESTRLAGAQHGGVLAGMILAGIGGSAFRGRRPAELRRWTVAGCLGSAVALGGLAVAAIAGPGWPLAANVVALGFANGVFAVAAIGSMMGLAGAGSRSREGVRMGVWGAAQAIAFGLGGLIGALGVDGARALLSGTGPAFQLVFASEAALFLAGAGLALAAPARTSGQRMAIA
jgi:BCD family chlorophyll transporter-like MFS transporter